MSNRVDPIGEWIPLPDSVCARIRGTSWRADDPRCPPLEQLAYLRLPYVDFGGAHQQGELIASRSVADDLVRVFADLFAARFPIERMVLVDDYDGDDERSMAANNCSAFNFREIAHGGGLSKHSFGVAVDINPVQNPFLIGDVVSPPAGEPYLDRSDIRPGMIVRPGPVVDAFESIGWRWGGDWTELLDYHHFYKPDEPGFDN